jgi:uncharacterized protein
MTIKHKELDVQVKADEQEAGTFTALASVFNNVDLVGDRVLPGAFKNTLNKWRESGKKIPVILSHRWDDIEAHIGYSLPEDVKETPEGLQFKGRLDVDDSAVARKVYKLLKEGRLTGMSFGYTVEKERVAEDGANELLDVDLVEFGPTLKGANPEAQLQAVKAVKAAAEADTETSEDTEDGKDEEPPAKSTPQGALRREINRLTFEALTD